MADVSISNVMSLEEANNAMLLLQDTLFALERMNPLVSFRIIDDSDVREQARIAAFVDFCTTKPIDFNNRLHLEEAANGYVAALKKRIAELQSS